MGNQQNKVDHVADLKDGIVKRCATVSATCLHSQLYHGCTVAIIVANVHVADLTDGNAKCCATASAVCLHPHQSTAHSVVQLSHQKGKACRLQKKRLWFYKIQHDIACRLGLFHDLSFLVPLYAKKKGFDRKCARRFEVCFAFDDIEI